MQNIEKKAPQGMLRIVGTYLEDGEVNVKNEEFLAGDIEIGTDGDGFARVITEASEVLSIAAEAGTPMRVTVYKHDGHAYWAAANTHLPLHRSRPG